MNRFQLEHLIKAAGTITETNDLIVIGSQAILGTTPIPDPRLITSIEADIYPREKPELADLIDGSIGELSPFHNSFGYYAHGVGPETAVLPHAWEKRLVPIRSKYTKGITGWCLEVHDLAISKLVASREKDLAFVRVLIEERMLKRATLLRRARLIQKPKKLVTRILDQIVYLYPKSGSSRI